MTAQAIAAAVLTIDGAPPPPDLRILAIRVVARFGAPTQCELTLHDAAGQAGWPAPFRLSASLTLRVVGEEAALFDGEVTCVELVRAPDGTTTARVRGYDLLHRLRKRQALRVLEDVTPAGLARTLTGDLGVDVTGPDTPVLARLVQHRQSDFDLLVETAARAGYLTTLDGTTLRMATLAGYGEPIPLRFGDSLFEVGVEANIDRSTGGVTAVGWDPGTAEPLRAHTAVARTGRRIELAVPAAGEVSLVEHAAAGGDDLAGTAQLALDLRTAQAVVVRGTAAGDARIRPGARICLSAVAPSVDGIHVVSEVDTTIDGNGYQSSFSTEPPAPPRSEPGAAITLGHVLAVDDPAGRGRVRVCLPTLGDLDVGWLGVVCPGAGRGKGLVALPEVGDTVAVALPHAEPTAALVLGSLYGALVPPDPGVQDNAVRRWSLRTADGQSVVLDDAAHAIRLTNRDGSGVELAPEAVRLTATTDLVIDAAGHAITIRARAVDFEHALI